MSELAVTPRAQPNAAPIAVAAALLAAVAAAWIVLVGRMSGMDLGPGGDPGGIGWFAVSWTVMTVAMMLPAAAPAIARLARARGSEAPSATLLFAAAYLLVWTLAGLAGFAVVLGIRDLHLGLLAWSSAGRFVAGGAIVAAGLYQLTGIKRRWLARCAASETVLRRTGSVGALRSGVEHGASCVACCWTLMAALYALGLMSIAWMALLTVLIAAERFAPRPAVAVRAVAAVLLILGVAVAVSPRNVPALTIPPHAAPMGMKMSGMG